MKRLIGFLCVLFTLVLTENAYASGEIEDYIVDDQYGYYVYENEIKIVDRNTDTIRLECLNICSVYVDEETIYVNTWDESEQILVFRPDGEQLEQITLPVDGRVYEIAVTQGKIAYLYEDHNMGESCVAVYDVATAENTVYGQLTNPRYIDADGNYLIVHCDEIREVLPVLALVDLSNGEIMVAADYPPFGFLHLDIEENKCYIVSEDEITEISWNEKTGKQRLLPVTLSDEIFAIEDGILYCCDLDGTVSQTDLKSKPVNTLVIACYGTESLRSDEADLRAVGIMARENVEVIFRNYSANAKEDLILDLMAGRDQIDVLLLNNFSYSAFVNAGVLSDMNSFAQMQEMKNSGMYAPWLFDSVQTNGRQYVVPCGYVSPTLWRADAELLEKMQLELPSSEWTWNDFLDIARICGVNGYSVYEDSRGMYVFMPGVVNYINANVDVFSGETDFGSDAFREMCVVWKECLDESLAHGSSERHLFTETYFYPELLLEEDNLLVSLPDVGQGRVIDAEAGLIGVNANAKDRSLAMDFIAAYLSPEAQGGEWLPQMFIFDDQEWYAQRFPNAPDAEQFAAYMEIMEAVSLRDENVEIRHTVNEALTPYFLGEYGFDEALSFIMDDVDRILNE